MSGEAAPRATLGAEALERVFGARAVCNTCAAPVPDYRVVAVFLHETAVIRAYCPDCYPAAADGDYGAAGDGLLMDYAGFAARFGPPGPPPPPSTPVDRLLTRLLRDPALRRLSPASEAVARRRRRVPYPVRVTFALEAGPCQVSLSVTPDGRVAEMSGDPAARARIEALLAG